MPGQEFCSSRHDTFVDDKFKSKYVDKFAKKYLIWQAICSGSHHTQVYVILGTLKSNEYIEKCLNKRFLMLIRQHNSTFVLHLCSGQISPPSTTCLMQFPRIKLTTSPSLRKTTNRKIPKNFNQSNATENY
jgi:hypothetical protein